MMKRKPSINLMFWGISMIVAPLLQATSTFFWEGTGQGITGGALVELSAVFWIPAFIGLFDLLREKMPIYATWGLLPAFFSCIGAALFGFRDIYAATFHIARPTELQGFSTHALTYNFILFLPGLCFPLSIMALGFFLAWKKVVPWWIGMLLCLGAIAIPLSRIPRIELIGHVADFLLLIPLLCLGWALLMDRLPGIQATQSQTMRS